MFVPRHSSRKAIILSHVTT